MARVFITGSTDGLGLAAARSLVAGGHEVVLHARTEQRAVGRGAVRKQASGVVIGDLASAEDVHGIADQVNAIGRMDAVIHNAGLYSVPERGSTPEGHATLLAINTLAPYMLTALIDQPDRLVYLSSGLHRGGEGSLDDLDWRARPWDAARAHAESKLHLVALGVRARPVLARRAQQRRRPGLSADTHGRGGCAGRPRYGRAYAGLARGRRRCGHAGERQISASTTASGTGGGGDGRPFQDALLAQLAALTGVRLA